MSQDPRRARSKWVCERGSVYARWYLRRHFHAVRLARDGLPPPLTGRPIIICANHPSWWDPLVFLFFTKALFPGRAGYGPMDARALGRYGVLRKIGVFGISPGREGAAQFLRVGESLLRDSMIVLWITAEGVFADPRRRPLRLRRGLAHLAYRSDAAILPLALEYPFWDERTPEVLARFGAPIEATAPRDIGGLTKTLEYALTDTMDALAAAAALREGSRFVTVLDGKTGVGGVYDAWRRVRAWSVGRRFDPSHGGDGT